MAIGQPGQSIAQTQKGPSLMRSVRTRGITSNVGRLSEARTPLVRFPRPTPRRWVGGPMPRKGGNETVLGSARFRCSSMGECDTYLEFDMSKDSIGAAEFGFGQPCTAQGQFKSRKGAKMSPWRQPGDNLATMKARLSPGCSQVIARL